MNHITSEFLIDMFSPKEIIEIVKNGILKFAEGRYVIPERMHITRGDSTNLIMPAFGEYYFCTKLISVDPHNHIKKLPIISGLLILNDSETGETLATMDAPIITALRTAAVGSIGLDLISGNVTKLGVIGLGVQGLWQTIFACSSKSISEIYCYSRSEEKFISFQTKVNKKFPTIKITWCSSSEDVVHNSEIIITCTTSSSPVFNALGLDIHSKRFSSVGSFTKNMQELPDEVYQSAEALIIDSQSAKTEVGDVRNAISNGWIEDLNIYTLAEILSEKKSIANHKKIVFKSVGMAAFDLALAIAAYEKYNMK